MTNFIDTGVTAGAIREFGGTLIEELGDCFFITDPRDGEAAEVQLAGRIVCLLGLFGKGDDLFNERAQRLCFGKRGFNSSVSDKGNREVTHHSGAVWAGDPEDMSSFTVAHWCKTFR